MKLEGGGHIDPPRINYFQKAQPWRHSLIPLKTMQTMQLISAKKKRNQYLRCTKCEVHEHVRNHVICCTKKHVPRFLILEALKITLRFLTFGASFWLTSSKTPQDPCLMIKLSMKKLSCLNC